MEEQLKKLVNRAEPKKEFNLIISKRSTRIQTNFEPPLVFPTESCYYEMALTKLETYYSFPNIKSINNKLKVSFDSGKSWKMITIPIGSYEIDAINRTLQRLFKENGGKDEMIKLFPNRNTLKCVLQIKKKECQIDFRVKDCVRSVLGFDAKLYKFGRHESEHLVDIMSVNSILVNCDIIGASRINGIEAPVIYNFFPNVSPGEKIIEEPKNLIYVPVTLGIISRMTCWLTDQDKNALDLRGEKLTISFHLKSC